MGFLEAYTAYACGVTDCPMDFHNFMALSTAATVIGRRRYVQFGHIRLYPNLYIVLLSPSTFSRKTTALSISQYTLRRTDQTLIYPTDFSQEKMMEILKDNPAGVFCYYEFKTLMDMMERSYLSGLKSFFTEIFDGNDMTVARKAKTFTIENPCINLISATTSTWFTDSIKTGDILSGFLTRFIYVYSKNKLRDDSMPAKPDLNKKLETEHQLSRLQNLVELELELSPEAFKLYDSWYKKFIIRVDSIDEKFNVILARLNVYALKIAIILETCETLGNIISSQTMERALHYADWLITSTLKVCEDGLHFTKLESSEKKILKLLKIQPKTPRSILMRKTSISSWDMDIIIKNLTEKKLIDTRFEKESGSQKPSQVLILLDDKIST